MEQWSGAAAGLEPGLVWFEKVVGVLEKAFGKNTTVYSWRVLEILKV